MIVDTWLIDQDLKLLDRSPLVRVYLNSLEEVWHTLLSFSEKATKYCGDDGQWFRHPESSRTWTNYTLCAVSKEKWKVSHVLKLFINDQHVLSLIFL